ncbi:hypothetical protein [Francisella persica]|nr:hypothetical protein [Francisella persica]
MSAQYRIGSLGEKCGLQEKKQWFAKTKYQKILSKRGIEKILALPCHDLV